MKDGAEIAEEIFGDENVGQGSNAGFYTYFLLRTSYFTLLHSFFNCFSNATIK